MAGPLSRRCIRAYLRDFIADDEHRYNWDTTFIITYQDGSILRFGSDDKLPKHIPLQGITNIEMIGPDDWCDFFQEYFITGDDRIGGTQ